MCSGHSLEDIALLEDIVSVFKQLFCLLFVAQLLIELCWSDCALMVDTFLDNAPIVGSHRRLEIVSDTTCVKDLLQQPADPRLQWGI